MGKAPARWFALLVALAAGCAVREAALDFKSAREHGFETVQVDAVKGDFRIVVWSPGVPLEVPAPECLRGDGWWLQVIALGSGRTMMNTGGWWTTNYPCILDYSRLGEGVLKLTCLTYDPRCGHDGDYVPFVRTTHCFTTNGDLTESTELLLAAQPAEDEHVHKLVDGAVKALLSEPAGNQELDQVVWTVYDAVAHLRNTAVERPRRAKAELEYVLCYTDGALGEMVCVFWCEVDTIIGIQEGTDR
ncbi:MAG: hypothetical protein ACYTAN_17920 [Planctomycetota bacterium]|jgi:hypothetical protein